MANLWDKIKEAVSGNSGNQEAQSSQAEPTPQSQPSRGLGGRPAASQMSERTAAGISSRVSAGKTKDNALARVAINANKSYKEKRYNNAKQRLDTAKNNLAYVTDTWQNDEAQTELNSAQKEYDEAKKEYEATLKNIESSQEANKFLLEALGKTQDDYPYNQGVYPTAFDMLAQSERTPDTGNPRSPDYIAPMEVSSGRTTKPGTVAQDSLIDGPLDPNVLAKNEAQRKNYLVKSNKDTWGETRQGANGVLTNDRREQLIKELNEDPYAGYAQDEVSAQQVNQRRQAILDELAQIDDAIGNGKMSYGSDKFFESAVNTITGATKQTASGITNFFGTAAMGLTDLSEKLGGDLDYEQSRQEAKQIQDVADALGQGASDDLEKAKKGLNKLGQAGVDIATNVIQMGYDSVFGGASLLSMFVRSAGGSMQEARFEGATTGEQLLYGGIGGGIEVVTEKVADGVAGIYGKGAADEITEEVIRRLTKSPFGRTALRFFSNAISEGGEEVMSDLLNPLARMTYNGKSLAASYKDLKPSEIVYDFIIGATIGALGGGTSVVNGQNAAANMELSNVDQVQSNLEANGMNHNDAVKAASIMADIANGKTISKRDAKFLNKLNQPINTTAPIDQMNPFIPSSQQNVSAQEKAQTIQNMPDGIEKAIAIEYQKTRTQSDIDAQSQIFEEFAEEILSAQPGQVLLDGDNKVVGKVLAVTDKGIAFEVDGEPNIVTTYNGRGLLDPNTKLVSYLRGNGVIANEADVEQYQNPTQYESNLGTRVAPEPQRAPSPMKPSSMEETDSGTGVSEESVQERLDKLQQMRQTAVEEGFGEDYIAQLDERIAEVTREAANGEDVVAEESAPTAEQEPEEAQPAPSPIKPSSREETDSGTGTANNPIAETVATAEAKQETAQETAQEESTAPSETLANALGEATAEETAPETNPIAEAATSAPVETEQTTVENLSPAEKFYRENHGKRTFEATLKDGQKVKITKGKDGYTVRAQKPNADGTGFITKYQTLGTAKTIAEANQLVKESKKATPSTGNPIVDAAENVDFRYKENVEDSGFDEERWDSILTEELRGTLADPKTAEQVKKLSNKQVINRMRMWARAFKVSTSKIGLAQRLVDKALGITETTGKNASRENLQYNTVNDVAYAGSSRSKSKNNTGDYRKNLEADLYNRILAGEDVYSDYDEENNTSTVETPETEELLDKDAILQTEDLTAAQRNEIFALAGRVMEEEALGNQDYGDSFAENDEDYDEENEEQESRDYGPFAFDEDSDPDAFAAAALGKDSKATYGFDRDKYNAYLEERNDANVIERLETLQKYFPEKEFRIVRDTDYGREGEVQNTKTVELYNGDKHNMNKTNGGAYIEEVYSHTTSPYNLNEYSYGKKENEWLDKNFWLALSKFGDEGQDKKKVYSDTTYMPTLVPNPDPRHRGEMMPNPRMETKMESGKTGNLGSVTLASVSKNGNPQFSLTNGRGVQTFWIDPETGKVVDVKNNSKAIEEAKAKGYKSVSYVASATKGLYNLIIRSNVHEGIQQVLNNHTQNRKTLDAQIKETEETLNRVKNTNKGFKTAEEKKYINSLSKKLEQLKETYGQERLFSGLLEGKYGQSFTLGDFRKGTNPLNNKEPFTIFTKEERQLIESYVSKFGNSFDNMAFKSLGKSKDRAYLEDLLNNVAKGDKYGNGIKEEDIEGILGGSSEFGTEWENAHRASEDVPGLSGRGVARFSDVSKREFSSYSDLSKEDRAQLGRNQDLRGYSGTGEVVDDRSPVQSVSGTASTRGKGTRRPVVSIFAKTQAKTITNNINSRPEAKLTIRNKGGEPGATVNAKRISGQTYLQGEATGDLNPSNYTGTVKAAAETILKAANEFGIAVVQFKGQLYNQHTDANNSQYTTRVSAYNAINAGYIAVSELTEENAGIVMQDALHEITHKFTDNVFGGGSADTVSFVENLAKKAKVTIDESKVAKVIRAYSDNGTLDSATADELISRIAEGDNCGGSFTNAELEKLQQALFDSDEWKNGTEGATAFSDLADYARTQLRNRPQAEKLSKAKPPTSVGVGTYTPQQQSTPYKTYQSYGEKETYRNSKERTDDLVRQAKTALENNDFDAAQELIRMAGTAPQNTDNGMYSDEMMDMYRGKYKYKEQFTINEKGLKVYSGPVPKGTPMGIYEYANPSKTFGDFNDYPQGRKWMTDQERAEVEQAANEWHESMDEPIIGRTVGPDNLNTLSYAVEHAKQVSGFTTMNTVWDDGKERWAYNQVKELKDRVGKQRSILNTPKLVPESFGTSRDIRSAGQRRANVIRLMKDAINGNGSMTGLFQYAQTMRDMKGTGQYFTPEVIYSLQNAAIAEAEAYAEGNPDSQRMQDFRYTAANALSQLQKQMENVDRIERTTRASLDALTTKYGKGNAKSFVGSAKQWLDSMQIDGGNFWRMMGGYNKAARNNAGYAMQRAHDKAIATQISTMAEAKNFFADVKDAKGFKDFANGKAMASDIPIIEYNEGEKKWEQTGSVKLSLLQAVKLKMTMDTLNAQAPDRLIRLKGFAVRDEKGNDTFINIPYKLDANERVQYLKDLYDSVAGDIEANEAASKYMKAAVDMFANFSPKLQAEAMKVNGYLKEMFAKGQYVPIQYANADGHKSRDWELVNDLRQGLNYERIMQNRTRSYGGYAVVNPISQTVDSYISQASNYIAFADLGNKLNIMSNKAGMNGGYGSVVREAFGDSYGRFYDNYVKSINMIRQQDPDGINKNLAKARQLMMQGALVGSLSVPIKQVSSYFSSMGVLDPRAVIAAYRGPLRRSAAGINNPFMLSRVQGSIDPDVSQALANGWVDKLRRSGKLGAVIANATNIMDSRTVANVYWASILDVEYNSGLTKAQLYNNGENAKGGLTAMGEFLVNSKFEEAVLNTQPIFTPQARNELSRTNSQLLRMFSTFRTQQTQNYNRLLTTIGEYNAAKKSDNKIVQAQAAKELRDTIGGQVMASASLAALTMVADFLLHRHKKYKDEDGEVDPMKIAERFALNAIESAGGTYLFGDAITKYLLDAVRGNTGEYASNKEFYGISMGAISSVESIFRAWTWLASDLAKGGKHAASNARYVVNYTATTLGIPVQNAYNLINMFYQWGKTITGNDNEYEDIFKGWDALRTDYGSQLFNAIQAGNTAKADKAAAKMGDKIDDIIKASALERLRAGASDDEVAQVIADYTSNYRTEADKWVREAHMEIDTGYKFNNMKKEWKKGNITSEEAIQYQQKYGNKSKADAQKTVKGWEDGVDSLQKYGVEYGDMQTAYINGKLPRDTYIKAVMEYGDKTREEAEQTVYNADFKAKYGVSYDTGFKSLVRERKISDSEAVKWRMKCSGVKESTARNYVEKQHFLEKIGYEGDYTTYDDIGDTWATKEKMGLQNFYEQYGNQFKSPKAFGRLFQNIKDTGDSGNYPRYTYTYNGKEEVVGAEKSAVITELNKAIANGDISYETAHAIWTKHYQWSDYKTGAWRNVHK